MSRPSHSRFLLPMVLFAEAATAVAVPPYLAATSAFAAGHLASEGIAGSSTRPGRVKWFDVVSVQWGVPPAAGPRAAASPCARPKLGRL